MKTWQGVFFAYPAFEPVITARFAFLVAPQVVTDINSLILFDSAIAHIAVVFFEFAEERFLKVSLFRHRRLILCSKDTGWRE